jgi:hypothetical protein
MRRALSLVDEDLRRKPAPPSEGPLIHLRPVLIRIITSGNNSDPIDL